MKRLAREFLSSNRKIVQHHLVTLHPLNWFLRISIRLFLVATLRKSVWKQLLCSSSYRMLPSNLHQHLTSSMFSPHLTLISSLINFTYYLPAFTLNYLQHCSYILRSFRVQPSHQHRKQYFKIQAWVYPSVSVTQHPIQFISSKASQLQHSSSLWDLLQWYNSHHPHVNLRPIPQLIHLHQHPNLMPSHVLLKS